MPKTLHLLLVLGLLLSLAAFPAAHVFAQDPNAPIVRITQVDNSQFPQVTVYVSVTNAAGEPVAVDPSTIEVYENGQLMQASTVSDQGQIGTVTTLLAIDTSGSMEKGNKMQAARDAAKAYIDQMRPGDQAAVISFNTQVTWANSLGGGVLFPLAVTLGIAGFVIEYLAWTIGFGAIALTRFRGRNNSRTGEPSPAV